MNNEDNTTNTEYIIKELSDSQLSMANSNSFDGNRGDIINRGYNSYIHEIKTFDISNGKKQKILDKIYSLFDKNLGYESRFISVMYAGPANYPAKKFEKIADKCMETSSDICAYMENIRIQVKQSNKIDTAEEIDSQIEFIDRALKHNEPAKQYLIKLIKLSDKDFIEQYEKLNELKKFRKNSNLYKIYQEVKSGRSYVDKIIIKFENDDYKVYKKGERIFIKFRMRGARQLSIALKSRGYWWNSTESAWSTYLNRYNEEWAKNLSNQYIKYI